jgi:sugar lactone lactonase YvrE
MPGYFSHPKGLALDSQDHLYVVDANFEAVQIFNSSGTLLMDFGEEGQGPGEFWLPAGIFIDRLDRIWIADSYTRRVQVFDYVPEKKP